MTIEKVKSRKEELEKSLRELYSQQNDISIQINAHRGAIDDCKYWIKELESETIKE